MARRGKSSVTSNRKRVTTPKASSIKNNEPKVGGGSHPIKDVVEDIKKNIGGGSHKFDDTDNSGGGSHVFSKKEDTVTAPKAFDDIKSTSGNKKDPTKMNQTRREAVQSTQKRKQIDDYEGDKQLADKWFNQIYDLETHDIGNTGYQVKLGKAFADKDQREDLIRRAAVETGRTHKEVEDLYDTYKLRRGVENMADLADNGNFGGKALASTASWGTNFLSELGAVPALAKNAKDDDLANTDSFGHIMGEATDRARQEVANDIDNPIARAAYTTGMGLGDFAVNAAVASLIPVAGAAKYAVPALQGLDAAEDYSRLALDNGVSGRNAALTGATAGALDYAFNRFGLENIIKQGAAQTGKQVAKNMLKGGVAEGGNNFLQQILSLGADYALNDEKSQLGKVYQTALDSGMTEAQARNEAIKHLLKTSGQSAAAGAAFGGAFAGLRGRTDLNNARLEKQAKAEADQNYTDSILDLIENNTDETVPYMRSNNNSLPVEDMSYGELMDTATSSKYYVEDAKRLARQIRDLDRNLSNLTDISDIQDYMSTRAELSGRLNDLGYELDDQGRLWNTEDVQNARQTANQRAQAQAEAEEQDYYLQQLMGEPMFENQVPNLRPTRTNLSEAPSYQDIMSDVNMSPSRQEIAQAGAQRARTLVNNASVEDALSGRLETEINKINAELEKVGYRLNNSLDIEEIPNENVNSLVEKYKKTNSDRTRKSILKQLENEGYAIIDDEIGIRAERLDDILPTPLTQYRNPFGAVGTDNNASPETPENNLPHMNGTMYGDNVPPKNIPTSKKKSEAPIDVEPIDYDEPVTREPVNAKAPAQGTTSDNVNLVNTEINGTDISQRYKTLMNSELGKKFAANIEAAKEEGAFNKTVEGRKQTQEDAFKEYNADKTGTTQRNLTRQWDSGKDLDTAMLILNDALKEGNQGKTNLILLKQASQLRSAGRELRAARDYAGTQEGTLSRAAQYLDDQAENVLNSGKKVRDRIESMAESIKNDSTLIARMDIDDAAKEMLREAVNAGATKEDISKMLAMYQRIGKMGISKEAYAKVRDIYNKMNGLGVTSKARADLEAEAYKVLAQDIGGPRSLRDKWDAWRYLAMLGNPKTHIRNILGNTTHYMVTEAKDNLAALIESAVVGNRGERTKAVLSPADRGLVNKAKLDADEVYTLLNDSGNKYNVKSEINKARDSFSTKGMNAVEQFNSHLLDAEDYSALKRKYSKALARYLKANGADESIFKATDDASKALLEKGRMYAIDQAKQATFHEFSQMADSLSQFSNKLRNGTTAEKIGGAVLEGILPFKKTPINILKQGIKYSPVSLYRALKKGLGAVKTGKFTASEVIDDLASGLTGSGIVALGALLASQGWLTGKANDDYDVDNAESEQGRQNYALQIGDSSYTLDWLAPFSLPLFVGVELYNDLVNQGEDETDAVDKIINGMTTIAEPVTEMSMLQGLNNVINEVSYSKENALATIAANTTLGYFTQGVPTLAGQIARSIDPYRRSTYSDEDGTFTRQVDKTISKTLNKVPFLKPVVNALTGDSYGEKYIDYKGNPELSQGLVSTNLGSNVFTRAIDQMLSPGYYRKGELTDLDRELNRVYEATGEQVYPEVYTGKVGDSRLSKAEHTKYQTLFGQTTTDLFEKAIQSPEYANLDDDQKADLFKALRTLSKDVADHEVGGKDLSPSKQKDYDLYKSDGADAVIQKKLVGKILNDAGITNNEKNRAAYEEKGSQLIEEKTAEQQLEDTYGVTGENAMYAYNNGVTGEELGILKDMELYPGKKADYKDYAELHKALPQVIVTPQDYQRLYGTINSFDPKTKGVGQDDLINFFNATDPDYADLLIRLYWSPDAKNQPRRNPDGTWKKVKVK